MHRQAHTCRNRKTVIHEAHDGRRDPAADQGHAHIAWDIALCGKHEDGGGGGHYDGHTAAARRGAAVGAALVRDI